MHNKDSHIILQVCYIFKAIFCNTTGFFFFNLKIILRRLSIDFPGLLKGSMAQETKNKHSEA